MEHVSEEGGGKISTEERRLPFDPPTTSCPDAKIVKDRTKRNKTPLTRKVKESIHSLLIFPHLQVP